MSAEEQRAARELSDEEFSMLLRTLRYIVLNAGSPNYDKTRAERAFEMLLELANRRA